MEPKRKASLRFKIKHLVAMVLMTGLLLAGGLWVLRLTRLSAAFGSRAAVFATNEKWYANRAKQFDAKASEAETYERKFSQELFGLKGMDRIECNVGISLYRAKLTESKKKAARCLDKSKWNAIMRQKYLAAASHPWLTIGPDLPEPD